MAEPPSVPNPEDWFRVIKKPDGSFKVMPSEGFRRYVVDSIGSNSARITNVNSGVSQLKVIQDNDRASRITGDDAVRNSGGDGTGTTDSDIYSGDSSGTAWVTLATLQVTPVSAGGQYTFNMQPNAVIGGVISADGLFDGEFRLVEEESGGGTPVVLVSGGLIYANELTEGGVVVVIPADTFIPPSDPYPNNYDGIMVDIRLEFRRDTGSNEITAVTGAISVEWTP
jgi:hypothetical protein